MCALAGALVGALAGALVCALIGALAIALVGALASASLAVQKHCKLYWRFVGLLMRHGNGRWPRWCLRFFKK